MPNRFRPDGRGWAVFASILCLALPGAVVSGPAQAAPAPAEAVSRQAAPPTSAPDEAAALKWARRYGTDVEVESQRTETTQTFARPNGTLRLRQAASPQRVRRGEKWVPVDTTLYRDSGVVVPGATTLDVRFSAGGDSRMITLVSGQRSLSLDWPRTLPTPVLNGDTATYPEVFPGVDLQLAAGADSLSQVLVVKTPEAGNNPDLAELTFDVTTVGLTLRQDPASGFISAVEPSGAPLFVSDNARMWDSPTGTTDLTSRLTPAGADTEPGHDLGIPVKLTAGKLIVTPSLEFLSHPETKYPVYIDPGWSGGKEIWTHVSRKKPGTSFWTDTASRKTMRVGQAWDGTSDDDWRTIFRFSVPSKIHLSSIKRAWVYTNVQHSADCSPSPMQIWRTNYISNSSAVTWNNTKSKWWKLLGQVDATANKHECPKGNDEVRFAKTAVKKEFQSVADKKATTITLAFRARSESDRYQWKKLVPGSTYLEVEFNHGPGSPTKVGFTPCNTTACTAPVSTYDSTPTLSMAVGDADGGTLRYEYEVWNSTKKAVVVKSGTSVTGVGQNAKRGWSVPAKKWLRDGQYYWRGRGCDSYGCGKYSGWYAFKVDTANPANPTVSSTLYSPVDWNGGPGVPGEFLFRPGGGAADGVKSYNWSLNGGAEAKVAAAADGTAKRTVTPTRDMVNTLRVTAIDGAGNISGGANFRFLVRPIGASWNWSLDEAAGTVAASRPVGNQPATMTGTGTTWGTSGYRGSDASAWFTGAGAFETAAPVLDTTSSAGFTVAAAVYVGPEPADVDGDPTGDSTDVPEEGTPGENEPVGGGDDPEAEADPADNSDAPVEAAPALPATDQVAVSQEGLHTSLFRLGFRRDLDVTGDGTADPAWCFTVAAQDSATAARSSACTTQYLQTGEWVQLTGVFNKVNGVVKLYVQGTESQLGAVAAVPGRADWDANGTFAIGRGRTGDVPADRWTGGIDEVYAVPRQWTAEEIDAAVDHGA